ncbi:hypothetical protein BUALT_Bualt02G0134100 [Buddleja alternifolia]|uniref:Protein kinase domain-containing protein n=1 Tax=Buddleja alternifolia TaxID=168488 RepID=A0AAV6Y446_9LAMI|nr:hypothetical protein BUALT_Bualt02G0134100 [Buddleja alternifolia]
MSPTPHQSHIFLICFFTLIFLVESRLNLLQPSEHDYFSTQLTQLVTTPNRYTFSENSQRNNQSSISPEPKHSNKKKVVDSILEFLAGAFSGSGSGLVFSLFIKSVMYFIRRRKKERNLRIFSTLIKKPEDLAFLQRENGLANLDVIGRGGSGEVYKTVLRGGVEIAIKKIIQRPPQAEELTREYLNKQMCQIKSEVETVCRIRHRNLLPLLAHLAHPGCHYLVYEYMKNGSLQDYLQHATEGERELDWLARYKIALGVAAGLEHLHMNHSPCIIHRDLKPANILLDDEMEARIADFGLAKAVPDADSHVTTSKVAGTVGYIAPEYYQTFRFTDKCDIYSFGVVLCVLVSGKLPSDEFFLGTDEMILVDWIRNLMASDDPRRAIDPRMLGNGYEREMLLVLKVACFCTVEDPKERPNSRDVRCMLSQIMH